MGLKFLEYVAIRMQNLAKFGLIVILIRWKIQSFKPSALNINKGTLKTAGIFLPGQENRASISMS